MDGKIEIGNNVSTTRTLELEIRAIDSGCIAIYAVKGFYLLLFLRKGFSGS